MSDEDTMLAGPGNTEEELHAWAQATVRFFEGKVPTMAVYEASRAWLGEEIDVPTALRTEAGKLGLDVTIVGPVVS